MIRNEVYQILLELDILGTEEKTNKTNKTTETSKINKMMMHVHVMYIFFTDLMEYDQFVCGFVSFF